MRAGTPKPRKQNRDYSRYLSQHGRSGAQVSLFVVLEGIDGCGKTTQARLLAERIRETSPRYVLLTCEPTRHHPIGLFIRQMLTGQVEPMHWRTMALLFSADRNEHSQRMSGYLRNRNNAIVCDRYVLSTLAYQAATAPEQDGQTDAENNLRWLSSLTPDLLVPTTTIVLTLPAEEAARRRAVRGEQQELFETSELQSRLAEVYRKAHTLVGHPVTYIDGANPEGEVADAIWEHVAPLL